MYYSIYLSSSTCFDIFIDRDPDEKGSDVYLFKPDRVVPVYLYFKWRKNFKKAYLIRTSPGSCILPNVDRPVTELVSVSGSYVNRLKKITNTLRKYKLHMDAMPDKFFILFSLALSAPGFSKEKVFRLYKKFMPAVDKKK